MEKYRLSCADGAFAEILDYGATLHRIVVPDRNGKLGDVVLHSDENPERFPMRGMSVGRCANRIAGGKFAIDGVETQLEVGPDGNMLHSQSGNYGRRMFAAERLADNAVRLTLREEGEGGWHGGADAAFTFTFSENGGAHSLEIHYEITPDEKSVVNPTNHAYFNLAGGGDVLGHVLWLGADRWTPKGDAGMVQGEYAPVDGSPFDFREPRSIREALAASKPEDFRFAQAFDDNYALCGEGLRIFARVCDPASGRAMEAYTDMPGVQFFTPMFPGVTPLAALCLETQFYPNAVNCPAYPSPVVGAGETFASDTIYRFSAE